MTNEPGAPSEKTVEEERHASWAELFFDLIVVSVMPTVVSGNTNAATIMIGERAAELIAADHEVGLAGFVG